MLLLLPCRFFQCSDGLGVLAYPLCCPQHCCGQAPSRQVPCMLTSAADRIVAVWVQLWQSQGIAFEPTAAGCQSCASPALLQQLVVAAVRSSWYWRCAVPHSSTTCDMLPCYCPDSPNMSSNQLILMPRRPSAYGSVHKSINLDQQYDTLSPCLEHKVCLCPAAVALAFRLLLCATALRVS